jgi:hypothetical protein
VGVNGVGEFEGGDYFEGSGCGGVYVCGAEGEEGEVYCCYRGCHHTDTCIVYYVECTLPPGLTHLNVLMVWVESIDSTGTVFGVGAIDINSRGTSHRRYTPSPYTFSRRYICPCSYFPPAFGVGAVIPSGSGNGIYALVGEI